MTGRSTGFVTQPAAYGPLVLRLGLASVMIAHALLKPLVFTIPGTVAFFEAHGFPGWTVYPVFVVELVGGVLLAIGLWTRWAAVALICVLVGAVFTHWPNGWMFASPEGGWEYPAFLIVALVTQSLLGSGAYAIGGTVSKSTTNGSA